jgi:Uma2 family endonuclease
MVRWVSEKPLQLTEKPMQTVDSDTLNPGEPAWRIALLFPTQGNWTEADYLALDAGRLVEFQRGCVEVLDMPTKEHQRIVQYVYRMLFAFVEAQSLGEVFIAPLPVRLWEQKFREPDVVFVAQGRADYQGYPEGADLLVEVVSDDAASRRRDLVTKRDEYSKAGVLEYWMIDPSERKVTVGTLQDQIYELHEFGDGGMVTSIRLPGFELSVTSILNAANSPAGAVDL